MSEAEVHTVRQRTQAAREARARRGELVMQAPRGYVKSSSGKVEFDPDASVRARISGIFEMFGRHGSLAGTLKEMVADGQGFPVRLGDKVEWRGVSNGSLYGLLTSPVYAGAYVWGRMKRRNQSKLPLSKRWRVLLKDRHPAYISWEEFELNQQQLARNRYPFQGRSGGLLTGLLRCGQCGQAMTVAYRSGGNGGLSYACRGKLEIGGPRCQSLVASTVEDHVSSSAIKALSPVSADLSQAVAQQAEKDRKSQHKQWQLRIARAESDAADAGRAYDAVDATNRLVSQSLEDRWEKALEEVERLRDAHRQFCQQVPLDLSAAERASLEAAASSITSLWQDGVLSLTDRAEILRLMLSHVSVKVIDNSERVKVDLHWQGGNCSREVIRRPLRSVRQLSYYDDLCARVAALKSEGKSLDDIASALNDEGWKPARGDAFNRTSVQTFVTSGRRKRRKRPPAIRRADEWTVEELAKEVGLTRSAIFGWIYKNRVAARKQAAKGGKQGRWLISADADTVAAMHAWCRTTKLDRTAKRTPDFRPAADASN